MPTTLSDWLDLSVPERARCVTEAARAAGESALGEWISVATPAAHGDGVLAGIPFSVKDNIDVQGCATTAGSTLLRSTPAAVDATVVSALRHAGAVVLGKTNLHELAFGITSNNKAFGPVRNPFDPGKSAGGSSGGSAVSVASGVVPFALGTDTGGSVTIPAAYCGVVGFRPTVGRYPGDGVVNLSTTRDTVGIHARTVRDVRTLDEILTGERGASVAGLRIGIPRNRFRDLSPDIAAVVADFLSTVEHELVDLDFTELDQLANTGNVLVFREAPGLLARHTDHPRSDWLDHIASPDVRSIIAAMAEPVSVEEYEAARADRWLLRQRYQEVFAQVDVVLSPTTPVPPPLLGADDVISLNGRLLPTFPTVTRNVTPGTVAGLPMISIPGGTTRAGLPVGLCLEARPCADARLLATAELLGG
ncbi:amidase family protein [Actinokineospora globicatena]|uniref:Indole acetimide hydrolase n=1 Tax=Actinokineospora globicatena TaxID=103729 RepID=A0A9W6QQA3_9PSEU|nr:amidase family protein [Actinokineospora globicatena]GLW94966.1 indole acetimide hydrolase [Actinokineospora globicatena]